MGLSAYWKIPDLDNLNRLLQRMGVKWLRNGDTANFPSIWAMFHNNVNWKKEWDEQMRKRMVRACLEKWFAMATGYGSLAMKSTWIMQELP